MVTGGCVVVGSPEVLVPGTAVGNVTEGSEGSVGRISVVDIDVEPSVVVGKVAIVVEVAVSMQEQPEEMATSKSMSSPAQTNKSTERLTRDRKVRSIQISRSMRGAFWKARRQASSMQTSGIVVGTGSSDEVLVPGTGVGKVIGGSLGSVGSAVVDISNRRVSSLCFEV